MTTHTTTLAAALALLGTAHSHIIMNTPTPFNIAGTRPLLQVDPLSATAPFPCQGLFDVVSTTQFTAGTSQLVKFTGGAQHGGGSCQFSITYDSPPPADKSKWKTIYTLIGGCPVAAEARNLPTTGQDADGRADSKQCGNDSGVDCIRQFEVPIPKELPNGNATFAWTWFNNIGHREVYMNCAPVSITGGSGDGKFLEELPEMFMANVPGECTTGEGVLNIPNPGKFGRVLEQPAPGSEGTCAKVAGVPVFEGGSGTGGDGNSSSVFVPSSTAPAQTAAPSSSTSPSLSTGFVTQTTTTSSAGSAPSQTSATATPAPSANPGVGAGPSGSQPCSPDGAIGCFSPTSFGLCDHGRAIPQFVAPGTTCTSGQIVRKSAKFVYKGKSE